MPNHTFDLYKIQSATQRAKDYAGDQIKRVQRLLVSDADRLKREHEHLCKWCWYRRSGSLHGQAFTEYVCQRCDQELSHHNTGVPALCTPCAEKTGLCCACCGDMNGEKRTEVP